MTTRALTFEGGRQLTGPEMLNITKRMEGVVVMKQDKPTAGATVTAEDLSTLSDAQLAALLQSLEEAGRIRITAAPAAAAPAVAKAAPAGLQTIRSKALYVLKYLAASEQARDETLTSEQALAKAATTTEEGRMMQAAYTEAMRRGEAEDTAAPVAKAAPTWCCTAQAELERLAGERVQKDGRLTKEAALVKVLSTREGAGLYAAHVAAHGFGG